MSGGGVMEKVGKCNDINFLTYTVELQNYLNME